MRPITEQNMINAFGGESMAHMRYRLFAREADTKGYPNVARLWRAISEAELIHAGDHYRTLKHLDGGFVANSMGAFGPGDTLKNLGLSIAGETFEVEEMYPAFKQIAEFQGEKDALRSFEWSYQTEKMHLALFQKARDAVAGKNDVQLGPVQVCTVCGYTLEGEAPDECPVCGAKKDKFNAWT
jgi:rubrerythrin